MTRKTSDRKYYIARKERNLHDNIEYEKLAKDYDSDFTLVRKIWIVYLIYIFECCLQKISNNIFISKFLLAKYLTIYF